jgi:hypothetical protein
VHKRSGLTLRRLLFDGKRIADDETAEALDMEDGDSIEVLLEREYGFYLYLQCIADDTAYPV